MHEIHLYIFTDIILIRITKGNWNFGRYHSNAAIKSANRQHKGALTFKSINLLDPDSKVDKSWILLGMDYYN